MDFEPLLAWVAGVAGVSSGDGADEEAASDAARALLRAAPKAAEALRPLFDSADIAQTVRLARFASRLDAPDARPILVPLLKHEDSRVRRAAASALGRLGGDVPSEPTASTLPAGPTVEAALLEAWPGTDPAERRALAEALGKIGGERSAVLLATVDAGDDAELRRIVDKAKLMRARDATRTEPVALDLDAQTGEALPIELRCRTGLEALLFAEVRELPLLSDARIVAPGVVTATLRGPATAVLASRLHTDFSFVLETVPSDRSEVDAVVAALTSSAATRIFSTFTRGTPRLRIDWEGRGPQRGLTWKIAAALAERGIVNDSREAPWEARIRTTPRGALQIALIPRGLDDPRFAYRKADVPAASHPTIAAAIARFADVRTDDVVWDPFTGSGVELIECARRGPPRLAFGTDIEAAALAAARQNVEAAAANIELVLADATTYIPAVRPSLIVSNPPMGRRVHRGDVGPLLESFLAHLAEVAAKRARLVWISPIPKRTTPFATSLGFELERAIELDMGGFPGRLERWILP